MAEEDENGLKIEIDRKSIKALIQANILEEVKKSMKANEADIRKGIDDYFKRSFFNNKLTQFDSALDFTIEAAFRESITEAMDNLDFKAKMVERAEALMKNDNFIDDLAEKRIRASFGLKPKDRELEFLEELETDWSEAEFGEGVSHNVGEILEKIKKRKEHLKK